MATHSNNPAWKIAWRVEPGRLQSMGSAAAAAAAKSLQSCPTLRPHKRQPTRLPRPWDSPGKNTGMDCHFLELDTNEQLSMSMSKGNCLPKRRDSHLNLGQLRRVL